MNKPTKFTKTNVHRIIVANPVAQEAANEIYKLYLESQITLLSEFIEHPRKPGYKRSDILNKIKELESEVDQLPNTSNIFQLRKCEWCGCYDGIHKSNCKFLLNLP